jgi:hypothetical protein
MSQRIIADPTHEQGVSAEGLQVPSDIEGRAAEDLAAVGEDVEEDLAEYEGTLRWGCAHDGWESRVGD